jgi:hypothetical protein
MKLEDFLKRFEFLKDEWNYLVPAARYSLIYGFLLMLLVWIDKSLDINFYNSTFTFNNYNPKLFFLLFNLFLLLIFIILVLERLYINLRIIYYRFKYPLRMLNKNYFLANIGGHVYLFDEIRKELRWVKNWQTALDLDFVDEWTNIKNISILAPRVLVQGRFITKNGMNIRLIDYKYVNGIITQGIPKN